MQKIGNRMDELKEKFRKHGYHFIDKEVLRKVFLAFTYYERKRKGTIRNTYGRTFRLW